jgi:Secretion system C-terminal sorting domain
MTVTTARLPTVNCQLPTVNRPHQNTRNMNWSLLRKFSLFIGLFFAACAVYAQPAMKFKLKLMPDGERWGVYVKPFEVTPTNTITASGQVTVVMPKHYGWNSQVNVSGIWSANGVVHGPVENPTRSYIMFGFQAEATPIIYKAGVETLLFTFKGDGTCPDSLYLIDNETDPYNILPNSDHSNPGNEITVFDIGTIEYYEYAGNYAQSSWSCEDNDNDGTLNAHEDTNGNGTFDQGDASNLNGAEPGMHFKLQLIAPNQWGVYVKPIGISPTANQTITASGQVTVVMPKHYAWNSHVNVSGNWSSNAAVHGPAENPTRSYIQFGFQAEAPPIIYKEGFETLLFTFKGNGTCPDSLYLIDNETDPFNVLPNSEHSNPGNEITVFDAGSITYYEYAGNYSQSAWSCLDNDNDGILNAFEDTNGNGLYDAGVDVSDLNSAPCSIMVTDEPDNVTQCSGEALSFSATVALNGNQNDLIYQWEESTDGGTTWHALNNDTLYDGVITNTLRIAYSTNFDENCYRLKIWTISCEAVYSTSACVDVEGPIVVSNEPDNVTQCAGEGVSFNASVYLLNGNPNDLIYLWEYSDDNSTTWNNMFNSANISGANTPTLSIADVSGMYGRRFRMGYHTPNCVTDWTNWARLTVEGPITVIQQPQDISTTPGSEAYFVSISNNEGALYPNNSYTLTNYIWQISNDDGATWNNLVNSSGIYSGISGTNIGYSNSDTLYIGEVTGLNGFMYRSCYTSPTCSVPVYSDVATLLVSNTVSITDQPEGLNLCPGAPACFDITAESLTSTDPLQYKWQRLNGNSWQNLQDGTPYSGTATNQLCISNTSGLNNTPFRCAVQVPGGIWAYSSLAALYFENPPYITKHPADYTEYATDGAVFISKAYSLGQNNLSKQWQISADGGTIWQDITQASVTLANGYVVELGGFLSDTLTVAPIDGLNGFMFRNTYTTNCLLVEATNAAALHVEGPVSITDQPDDLALCAGNPVCFSIAATNATGIGTMQYQWQRWTAGGWFNLSNVGAYSGAFSNELCISDIMGLNNAKYRCGARTPNGHWIYSDQASLVVEGPITINQQPEDITICSNRPVLINTTVINQGAGQLTLRWQYKTPNGAWTPLATNVGALSSIGISNNGAWQGAFGQDLFITHAEGVDGYRFRLIIQTPQCEITSNIATVQVLNACQDETCDYDNDGIENEADPDFENCGRICLKTKLQLLPDSTSWAVMAKPFGPYEPTEDAMTTTGRFTVVAPADFNLIGLNNGAGQWSATNVTENVPGHPGEKFITFELLTQPNGPGEPIPFFLDQATTLFTLHHDGPCPNFLYLLENVPPGLQPNLLTGHDLVDGYAPVDLEYCGVFARKAWRCRSSGPVFGGPIIVVTTDSLGTPPITDREAEFSEGNIAEGKQWFTVSPNPAGDFVNITVSADLAEGRTTLSLWDVQGKKRQEVKVENASTKLYLSGLPAGVYLVSLAQNGRVVQREKLIKQ